MMRFIDYNFKGNKPKNVNVKQLNIKKPSTRLDNSDTEDLFLKFYSLILCHYIQHIEMIQ